MSILSTRTNTTRDSRAALSSLKFKFKSLNGALASRRRMPLLPPIFSYLQMAMAEGARGGREHARHSQWGTFRRGGFRKSDKRAADYNCRKVNRDGKRIDGGVKKARGKEGCFEVYYHANKHFVYLLIPSGACNLTVLSWQYINNDLFRKESHNCSNEAQQFDAPINIEV